MKVVKNENNDGTINVKADCSPAEVSHAFTTALESFAIQAGVTIDPTQPLVDQLKQQLNIPDPESIVRQQALLNLVPFAVDKSGVYPAYDPQPQASETLINGKPFSFQINIKPKPEYELTSYDPIEITVPPFSVPDNQLDFQLAQLAESFG